MLQLPIKTARLQYALLGIVAVFALTHFYLGAVNNFENLGQGQVRARNPFYNGAVGHTFRLTEEQARAVGRHAGDAVLPTTLLLPETAQAGLHVGDAVLTINGRPYAGSVVLLEELRHSRPGQPMVLTYLRSSSQVWPVAATVKLGAERNSRPPLWAWVLQSTFLFLPFFCLLTGLYVVFARPRSPHAWLILGILASFDAVFIPANQLHSPLMPVAIFWATIAQTAMPCCLMLFGIYFPERSRIDKRIPWMKWVYLVPILLLLPFDFLYDYGHTYSFNADAFVAPWLMRINIVENIIAALAIGYFFPNLLSKLSTSSPDARRRLRILYVGASVGLTPFFILVVVSLIRGVDVGYNIPQWITLPAFLILLLFPLSLAYVVVVQRAMDVSILIRQGTKYFFARSTIFVISLLLATWMSYEISLYFVSPAHHRNVDLVRIFAIIGLFFAFRFICAKRLQERVDQRFFREAYSTEQLLSELSDEARNFTEVAPLIATVADRIAGTLHIDRIAVFLRTGDTFQLSYATGSAALPGAGLSLPATSATITTLARSKGPASVYRDDPSSWLVDATDAERTALADLSTELLVPLPGRNRLIGVMALGPKRSEEPYSRTDRQLLQTVASQTGLALENAELLENLTVEVSQRERVSKEIEIAREVQQRLFPQSYPQLPDIDLAGYCRPAQAVGGDYYDFFLLPASPSSQPRLAIAIGDISGKGISAALLMASLRASLRSIATLQAESGSTDLTTLMRSVNRLVFDSSTSNRYATFFYAELDPATRLLTFVNAGHNSPIILRETRSIALEPTGTVVGLLPDAEYEQATLPLHPGDTLLAFTDGLSEAMTCADEEWGEDRMIACAQANLGQQGCTHSASQMLQSLLTAADAFTDGAPQHDDMTLLVCAIS